MNRLFQKFKQDVMGIFVLAAGVFIALSLLSFNPADPSFNSTGINLKVTNYCGYVGSFLADAIFQLFGISSWFFVLVLIRVAVLGFQGEDISFKNARLIWGSLLVLNLSALVSVYFPDTKIYQNQIFIGGIIGLGLSQGLVRAFNHVGVQVVLWTIAAVLVVFYSEKTIQELSQAPKKIFLFLMAYLKNAIKEIKAPALPKNIKIGKAKESKEAKKDLLERKIEKEASQVDHYEQEQIEIPKLIDLKKDKDQPETNQMAFEAANLNEIVPKRKVVLKTRIPQRVENWELPKLNLIEDPPASRIKIDEKEIKRKAELLKEKLAHFSVTGEVVAARPGPAVTMFEFKPDADVKLSKITELADDLSLALSSESLRIIAPIPGRDVVGIETSNSQRESVYLKDMLADENFWKDDIKLPIALGKQANGEPRIVDLRKMPHLMVAGTTGSGKSVFVVSSITGLLYKHSPKTLRVILVDPKQVDLAAFEKIPHLAMPVVTDSRLAVNALRWAVREMEKRYKSMSKFGARGLEAYNENVSKLTKDQIEEHEKINAELESTPGKRADQYYSSPLPYIVIVIEEFGDLMTVDKANVEQSVVRLAQKARACGIHLILAMQSPRKEVVTGLIKTNIPGRISFKVSGTMDSRIILDDTGAERLLAQGDMLYKNPGGSNLIRHHGPYLKDSDIANVTKFWSDQAPPEYDSSAMKALEASGGDFSEDGAATENGEESFDEKYDEILAWTSTMKEVSASLIQRRFQVGYNRAARIVETFERQGVVGPANGSKPRQVLVSNFQDLTD